jgi:hypothetical protein
MNYKIKLLTMIAISAAAFAQTSCDEGAGPMNPALPKDTTPPEIVRKFAAQESVLKEIQTHYVYTMDVSVQTIEGATMDGEFRKVSEISYAGGVRHENVKFSPVSTLRRITMSKQDFDDIYERTPFVLNEQDLPQYNVLYVGQQKVDELDTWVFEAAPKQVEPGKRYFKGRVWVEIHDLSVVKSCGKNFPDPAPTPKQREQARKKHEALPEEVSPTFVTYRELIDNKYWLPVYVRSDEDLRFTNADSIHIKEVIKYQNYRSESAGK